MEAVEEEDTEVAEPGGGTAVAEEEAVEVTAVVVVWAAAEVGLGLVDWVPI